MSRPSGFKHTEETKQKMREHHGGFHRPHTLEERKKLSKTWKRIGHPKGMKGRHHSEETKKKMSLARQGGKNSNWKGGLTKLIRGIRRSPEYYQWRKAVLERDKYICQDCKAAGEVEAHHIQSILDKPELIFDIGNGLTLCGDCHGTIHGKDFTNHRRSKICIECGKLISNQAGTGLCQSCAITKSWVARHRQNFTGNKAELING